MVEIPVVSPTIPGMATLAELIVQQRKARGWSQNELAAKAGLTLSGLTKLEQGAVTDPRWSSMVALADALGISLDTFRAAMPADPEPPKKPRK